MLNSVRAHEWIDRRSLALHEWAQLLDSVSVPALGGLLRSVDERSTRFRQSSPFAGCLTAHERQAILNADEPRCP